MNSYSAALISVNHREWTTVIDHWKKLTTDIDQQSIFRLRLIHWAIQWKRPGQHLLI